MPPKHPRHDGASLDPSSSQSRPPKRPRLAAAPYSSSSTVPRSSTDLLSPLSDELLIRILSHLSLPQLLRVAPVSHRFHRLAEDSQLWKGLYYARFVLPRALRIPGFREGRGTTSGVRDHKLHYKGRRTLWADGRLGGLVREVEAAVGTHPARRLRVGFDLDDDKEDRVNWKRQFKIRHNWARGKCAVEELKLGPDGEQDEEEDDFEADEEEDRSAMLVKVVEGLAITADSSCGLRAWDLRTREVLAHVDLCESGTEEGFTPSCLAIDDRELEKGTLDMALGFTDGSFGVWRLDIAHKSLSRLYRHEKSSNGKLMGMAYLHPYLLTATGAVLISLYTFDIPDITSTEDEETTVQDSSSQPSNHSTKLDTPSTKSTIRDQSSLPPPYLLTSLKSHTSNPPLALSIRKTATTTVASIAYTFFVRQGWSIGIQDLHITSPPPTTIARPAPAITTRLAYTPPFESTPPRSTKQRPNNRQSGPCRPRQAVPSGPISLCYTHPYLLATLPDNTLLLHLCTSTAAALSISPGIRLWGHTSGISDAEITARGKAVSVSSRGEEMRVWELEGRRGSRSVEIRAESAGADSVQPTAAAAAAASANWEERRNWVGFDDEMVIVLKEGRGGRESLLVYDFT